MKCDQAEELKKELTQTESALREIVRRLHADLVLHPVGSAIVQSVLVNDLDLELRSWERSEIELYQKLTLDHDSR